MRTFATIIANAALISACATTTAAHIPDGMRVTTADRVASCTPIGDVHGVSGMYGVFGQSALSNARQEAFKQAHEMGANTVVWGQFVAAYGSTAATGMAYTCPPDKM